MIELDGAPMRPTTFPDGTVQIWKIDEEWLDEVRAKTYNTSVLITWVYTHDGELIQVAQLKDLLNSEKIFNIHLRIIYLPYGRQDKEISNVATFGLHSFSKLLNALEFESVSIMDPHSMVALDLINNSYPEYPTDFVASYLKEKQIDFIVFPDKGAKEKYEKIYTSHPMVYLDKVRDQTTGEITSLTLGKQFNVEGKNLLIIDDICDGGATFIGASKVLRDNGAKKVYLYVTYGLFTKGIEAILNDDKNDITERLDDASYFSARPTN